MRCDAHGNRQCRLSWSKQSGYRQPVTSTGFILLYSLLMLGILRMFASERLTSSEQAYCYILSRRIIIGCMAIHEPYELTQSELHATCNLVSRVDTLPPKSDTCSVDFRRHTES
jgi:hypothetical protein